MSDIINYTIEECVASVCVHEPSQTGKTMEKFLTISSRESMEKEAIEATITC